MRPARPTTRLALALVLLVAGCASPGGPTAPASGSARSPGPEPAPAELTVVDAAGIGPLVEGVLDAYRTAHPGAAGRITLVEWPAADLEDRLAGSRALPAVDLVLAGGELMGPEHARLWRRLLPDQQRRLPDLQRTLQEPAWRLQKLGGGLGAVFAYSPSGPLLEYAPERVGPPPSSPLELLEWARAHPGRFAYGRPATSVPGRTLLQGLPYLLGDRDPRDPVAGWDRTWAYLKELDRYVDDYPNGADGGLLDLAGGRRDIIAATLGSDLSARASGRLPAAVELRPLQGAGFHWLAEGYYAAIPASVGEKRLALVLDLVAFLLQPKEQARLYDRGLRYPGPAVRDVSLALAPADSQQLIQRFGRPASEGWLSLYPIEVSLEPRRLELALERWDREVAGAKIHP